MTNGAQIFTGCYFMHENVWGYTTWDWQYTKGFPVPLNSPSTPCPQTFCLFSRRIETLHGVSISRGSWCPMCKSLLSSVGFEKNRRLTTQRFDQYALIVFRRRRRSETLRAYWSKRWVVNHRFFSEPTLFKRDLHMTHCTANLTQVCTCVCFIFEWARAPRHFILGIKGILWVNCKLVSGSISRATRQWPGGMEAITFVASMLYQGCSPNTLLAFSEISLYSRKKYALLF